SGHVNRPGVYEAAMGLDFHEFLYGKDYAQGIRGGKKLKAVIPGGASAAILKAEEIEGVPLDFDGVAKTGSMLGSAATLGMDEDPCIVAAIMNILKFFSPESCGQCTPCREGTTWLYKVLTRIEKGEGRPEDVDLLTRVGGQMANGMTICVLADGAAAPLLSSVAKFRDEFLYHVKNKRCLAGAGAGTAALVTA